MSVPLYHTVYTLTVLWMTLYVLVFLWLSDCRDFWEFTLYVYRYIASAVR